MVARKRRKKRKIKWLRVFLVLIVFVGLIFGGCKLMKSIFSKPQQPQDVVKEIAADQKLSQNEKAKKLLAKMTLEEKVGQVFLVIPEAIDDCGHDVVEPCIGFKEKQAKYNVGGIILFNNNLKTQDQTKKLITKLQSWSKYPMFIAVDEEGGIVARISNTKSMGIANVGSMNKVKTNAEAHKVGTTIGGYLQVLGFNLDFAPVADVLINPNNKEIGSRAFSKDSQKCGEFAGEVVKGLQENNVLATLKHFPGHGGYESNSHEGLSLSKRTLDELRKTEFVAFKKAMEADSACVMVAHMSVPNVVGDNTPTTLSRKVVTDILKNELGYKGLVVSDALNMGAIVKFYGAEEAAVKCFNAGNDILLMPASLPKAYAALLKAVKDGKVNQERLDEAVTKILEAKLKYGIIKK